MMDMPNFVQEGDQFGQVSVVVWGGISIECRTDLTTAGFIEQILLQHVLVAAYGLGPESVLMLGNSRAHVERII